MLALALPSYSQTWFKVVPGESQGTTVTLPAGSTIRWCDIATGKVCSPNESIATQTVITAYCPSFPACAAADLTDGLNGTAKDIEILELVGVAQTVVVNGTSVAVPAIPPPTYAPIAFDPRTVYPFSVSNIPPAVTGGPPTFALSITNGAATVPFTCTYSATVVGVSAQSATFVCIPAPIQ